LGFRSWPAHHSQQSRLSADAPYSNLAAEGAELPAKGEIEQRAGHHDKPISMDLDYFKKYATQLRLEESTQPGISLRRGN